MRNEMFQILKRLNERPIPSGMVSNQLPNLLMNLGIGVEDICPYFLGTRNMAVYCGGSGSAYPELPGHIAYILIVHADKVSFVPAPSGDLLPDFNFTGMECRKRVYILDTLNNSYDSNTIILCEDGVVRLESPRFLDPSHRVVFRGRVSLGDDGIVGGPGLDNDCGMAIAVHLYHTCTDPFLIIFTDNEEGQAKVGHYSIGAAELDTALRISWFDNTEIPIIVLDGLDATRNVVNPSVGQASVAWNISNGSRGCISPTMAGMLGQFVESGSAVWYDGYTSDSDDWKLYFPNQFRVGVRGNGWHNQLVGGAWAVMEDLPAIAKFLQEFIAVSCRS